MDSVRIDREEVLRSIDRYTDMIYRIALNNLGNREDAEDMVQEVFLRLIRQASFESEQHLKAWLIRVTINLCRNLNKTYSRRRNIPLTTESVPFSDEQQRLLDEIRRLPAAYRNVIYLFYIEGYKIAEIAALLDSNEKTVSVQLSRARKKLKDYLLTGRD